MRTLTLDAAFELHGWYAARGVPLGADKAHHVDASLSVGLRRFE